MANYTIIGGDQKEYGPVTEGQLRQWIADNRVNAQTRVKVEGATEWKSLSEIPEFAAALKSSASPPPPMPTSAPATLPKTSALAVTSLVLGILGMFSCGLTALAGLICGIVALVKVKEQRRETGRRRFCAGRNHCVGSVSADDSRFCGDDAAGAGGGT